MGFQDCRVDAPALPANNFVAATNTIYKTKQGKGRWRHDTQYNDIHLNDTQRNDT